MFPPLDKVIHKALLADRRPADNLLHCSSASWQPLRFTQLSAIYLQDETDVGSLITMKLGTLTHEWLADYLVDNPDILGPDWELVAVEWDLTPYLPDGWTGTCDYVFVHKPTNTVVVGDLKTIKPEGMAWLGDRPKPEHTTQVSCYHSAIQKWVDEGIEEMPGTVLHPDIFVLYLPKGKDSKQNTIEPQIITAPAEPSAVVNMVGIKRQVDDYLAEYERTGEADNRFLAAMPEQELKIGWNKAQNVWDVTARNSWVVEFIGKRFGEQLCPSRPSLKVGHYTPDGFYIARKGITQPEVIPPMPERGR